MPVFCINESDKDIFTSTYEQNGRTSSLKQNKKKTLFLHGCTWNQHNIIYTLVFKSDTDEIDTRRNNCKIVAK